MGLNPAQKLIRSQLTHGGMALGEEIGAASIRRPPSTQITP